MHTLWNRVLSRRKIIQTVELFKTTVTIKQLI